LQFHLSLLNLRKPKLLPSGLDTLSPTPPYEVLLPLGRPLATVGSIAKLPKVPTCLGLENALKGIFECFSGMFCVGLCLTCENFVSHIGYSLVFVHELLPFPL
jgi:hypothetical protein